MTYIINNREVLWDFDIAERISNVTLKNHKPVRKNLALKCESAWEGEHNCYISLVKVEDTYRMYYRAAGYEGGPQNVTGAHHGYICVAESRDGKTFTKPNLGIFNYKGSTDNNIIFTVNRENNPENIDNFSVYLDENPDCPQDEKFKALTSYAFGRLDYYKSADGLHFEFVRSLAIKKGCYDTLNISLWNPMTKKYHIYFRDYHRLGGEDVEFNKHMIGRSIRDIRVVESEDFIHWSEPRRIQFKDGIDVTHLYTNGITKYHRANVFFGLPVRYKIRGSKIEESNFRHLNNMGKLRDKFKDGPNIHEGCIVTDCMFIVSRDGKMFEKTNEAFYTPGVQNGENWVYGDGYLARGTFETESDYPGEPNELSFYAPVGSRTRKVDFIRYTLRLDGFRSWSADHNGGTVITKIVEIQGNTMKVNFATSALGYLRIKICDEIGNEIPGYDSGMLFGDDVERPVEFEKPLSELSGMSLKLKFEMSECDFYLFVIEQK